MVFNKMVSCPPSSTFLPLFSFTQLYIDYFFLSLYDNILQCSKRVNTLKRRKYQHDINTDSSNENSSLRVHPIGELLYTDVWMGYPIMCLSLLL